MEDILARREKAGAPSRYLSLTATAHQNHSDLAHILPAAMLRYINMVGKIGAVRASRIIAYATRTFLVDALVAAASGREALAAGAPAGSPSSRQGAKYALGRSALLPKEDVGWGDGSR